MGSLRGKVVMITGGAGGFGQAFIEKFLNLGCKVCVCDVNAEQGEKSTSEFSSKFGDGNVKFVKCDVTSDSSFKDAFKYCKDSFDTIDILINNAGIGNEKEFTQTINVNLLGAIRGSELALEHMSKAHGHHGGRIVNIASIAGLRNIPFGPFYAASKAGIVHYTRAVGHPFHLSYTGVVVQCLCPSLVETPFIEIAPEKVYNDQAGAAMKSLFGKVPLLKPEEIADALITLIEDNKPGGVLAIEKGKDPYYVEAAITDLKK